jgi:hypothetical protein
MVVASTGFSESLETSVMLCPVHRYVVLLLLLLLLLGEREENGGIVT